MEWNFLQTVSGLLINLGMAWTIGVLVSRYWLRQRTDSWQFAATTRLLPMLASSLATCCAGVLLALWSEAATMGDVPWLDAWPAVKEMLASTHYGHASAVAIGLLFAALLAHVWLAGMAKELSYLLVLATLFLLFAGARASAGHAFEHGFSSPAFWIEWLHIICMALWVGIVLTAAWIVLPEAQSAKNASTKALASYLNSISNWATLALGGILVTGVYNSIRMLGSPRDLLATDYGHVLLAKLVFMTLAIILGGWNRFFGLSAALSADAQLAHRGLHIVVAILRIESVVLLLVLGAAVVLANNAPTA